MTTHFYWTIELVFELIKRYKDKPELWDFTSVLNKNKEIKHQAWKELAKAVNTDVRTVERKMRMLVGQPVP